MVFTMAVFDTIYGMRVRMRFVDTKTQNKQAETNHKPQTTTFINKEQTTNNKQHQPQTKHQ